jgi:DNA-binding HxlR family transcriptional regulator
MRRSMTGVAGKRSYGDPCGIARALDVVGDRWALLVVRELVLGPKRFTDLRAHLPGIATDVLSQRLRQLEQAGIVRPTTLPSPASGSAYELTDRGHELEPVLHALGRWGSREGLQAARHEMTSDAFAVALATVFDPVRAESMDAVVDLVVGGEALVAEVQHHALTLRRGPADQPHARIEGSVSALRAVLWHGRSLAEAEADGSITVGGLRSVVRRFLKLFPAPSGVNVESTAARARGR